MPPATSTHTRRWGSDSELSYASPVIFRATGADEESLGRHASKRGHSQASSDEDGTTQDDGRNRRSRGSSDDDGSLTSDGFCNEDLRVGGPRLCSIPVDTTYIIEHPTYLRQLSSTPDLIQHVWGILKNHSVATVFVHTVSRRSRFDPEPNPVPTLLIKARRHEVDGKWLACAREIRDFLYLQGLKDFTVEIQDPQAEIPLASYPVLPTDPVFEVWDTVSTRILNVLDLTYVDGIGCFRRGRSSKLEDNPPTVLIIANPKSNGRWKSTRDTIVKVLDEFRLPMVAVEIVKDRIQTLVEKRSGFSKELLNSTARPGESIAHATSEGSGTLGAFVELLDAHLNQWQPYAMTCFHCVEVPAEQDLPESDKKSKHKFICESQIT